MDLVGGEVLKPRTCGIRKVQRKVANDDGIVSRTAQLARQAVVVESEPGIRLSRVLGEHGRLSITRGKRSGADFPAEHAGARRLR